MSNTWTVEKYFNNYTEAAELKKTLQDSTRGATLQIKIHRYAPLNGVERFGVKIRTDPNLQSAVEQVEKTVAKRKKNKGE